jgi:site-specific DNA-methyltransferase (adenine-specific)
MRQLRAGELGSQIVLDDDLVIEADASAVLAGLPDAAFELIYIDPPFNTGQAAAGRG